MIWSFADYPTVIAQHLTDLTSDARRKAVNSETKDKFDTISACLGNHDFPDTAPCI